MWASTTDDNAVYAQSDKRMCQLINIRGTSLQVEVRLLHAPARMRSQFHGFFRTPALCRP